MGFIQYVFKGNYIKTNKNRTIKFTANSDIEEYEKIDFKKDGFESLNLVERYYLPATENQLEYAKKLNIQLPLNATFMDATYAISKKVDNERAPGSDLLDFIKGRGLAYTDFFGKKACYKYVFLSLKDLDKIAFFIFSVYRFYSNDRQGNLDKSPYKDIIYDIAKRVYNHPTAFKSLLNNYTGSDLRFFGTLKGYHDESYYGGSKSTTIFKLVSAELINVGLLSKNSLSARQSLKNKQQNPHTQNSIQNDVPIKTSENNNMFQKFDVFIEKENQRILQIEKEHPNRKKINSVLWPIVIILIILALYLWLF